MKITTKWLTRVLALVAMAVAFVACNTPAPKPTPTPDDPNKGKQEEKKEITDADIKKIEFLDVSVWDQWVFYSLKENKVYKTVKYDLTTCKLTEDLSKDTNWDIAFHRWDVMTKGGAFKSDIKVLTKAYEVKLGDFTQDAEQNIDIMHPMKGKKTALALVNPLISGGLDKKDGWCSLEGMPPKADVSQNVWFVKTADSKTVAIRFIDCKKKDGKNGAVTLNYAILR